MTTTSWEHDVDGSFNALGNWTDGVPGPGDTALITVNGAYTVTSLQDNTVEFLQMAKKATLAVSLGTAFDITNGTGIGALAGTIDVAEDATLGLGGAAGANFDNSGTISLRGSTEMSGTVTLAGKGKISLLDSVAGIGSNGSTATLNNGSATSGQTISGEGSIGDSHLSIVNAAKGVIDATTVSSQTLGLSIDTKNFTNEGLLEATGATSILNLDSDITQEGKGEIKAETTGQSGSGAGILLDNATITGGAVDIAKHSALVTFGGTGEIDNGTTPVVNGGELGTLGGDLTITGPVKNSGALAAISESSTALLDVQGTVKGGQAIIAESGEIVFQGPTSAKVTFGTGGGVLDLFDAPQFTGTVAGMQGNTDAKIDLENIVFADAPAVDYNPTKHLLIVTDPSTGTTDTIKLSGIVGTPTFTASAAFGGSTLVADPPGGAAAPAPSHSTRLLTQLMASFGAAGGVAPSSGNLTDHLQSSDFAVTPPHG